MPKLTIIAITESVQCAVVQDHGRVQSAARDRRDAVSCLFFIIMLFF